MFEKLDRVPEKYRGVDKQAPASLLAKRFNDFCRKHGLGKLCTEYSLKGRCHCKNKKSPFVHKNMLFSPLVKEFLTTVQVDVLKVFPN